MELPTQYLIINGADKHVVSEIEFVKGYFKHALHFNRPCRAFKLEFDVETNAFETASEITGDFLDRAA